MARLWTWTIVLVVIAACNGDTLPQDREEAAGLPHTFAASDSVFDMRSLMVQYIIHKGCDYVSAYVRSHYMNSYLHHDDDRRFLYNLPPPSTKCNWKDEASRMCHNAHVHSELTHALVDCGLSYTIHALGLKDGALCNDTDTQKGHGAEHIVAVGRSAEPRSDKSLRSTGKRRTHNQVPTGLATANDSVTLVIPGGSPGGESHSASSQTTVTSPPLNDRLKKWCTQYSRYVRQKFRLNGKRLEQSAIPWLVKIYKYAEKYRTPRSYIHALVGCGQKYALGAFNVRVLSNSET